MRSFRSALVHSAQRFSHCKRRLCSAAAIGALLTPSLLTAQAADPLAGKVGRTVQETHAPTWPSQPQAPKGAPNVLVILTDDIGFGVSSAFGGPVPTATFDALAKSGLRYNRFNTTALCSPTRASLLTGRVPQNVGMGNVTNIPTGYEGYTSVIPKSAATVAEMLKENGFNTAMFGKNHLTPEWQTSAAGPFDQWPTGMGFEYFYGFLSADTSMWEPSIVENTQPRDFPRDDPNYFFEKDMADRAITWLRTQNAAAPDKPFFIYYAPGIAHAPHHAPKEWLEKFRGKFDQGWDKVREESFVRQKRAGIIPANAQLSPRPESLAAWDSLKPEQKRVYARLMEAFAASVAYSDYQTGRLIEEIRQSGEFDNTLIIFIQGDNGSSAEGGPDGLLYEQSMITGRSETMSEKLANIDEIGGPNLYNQFPAGWAWATNSPFPWWKQVASQAGGVRNGMVVSWPKHITEKGVIRSQYAHVSDIAPTILEAVGIEAPDVVKGVPQKPLDGISLAYTFTQGAAPSARRTQIYEMMENFGIYKDGWMAGTLPKRAAWDVGAAGDRKLVTRLEDRQWSLFNLESDFTTANDLATKNPSKLKELQDLFWMEAAEKNILPIHDYSQGVEGRPSLGGYRTRFTYRPGMDSIAEDAAPHTIGKSFRIEADVTAGGGTKGVMIAQGGRFGGYSFYLKDGRPTFHYNAVGADAFTVTADTILEDGKHTLSAEFVADKAAPGTPGTLTLHIDGKTVGSGRLGRTVAAWISHTEGLDIGLDRITPVSPDYTTPGSAFTGDLHEVRVTIK